MCREVWNRLRQLYSPKGREDMSAPTIPQMAREGKAHLDHRALLMLSCAALKRMGLHVAGFVPQAPSGTVYPNQHSTQWKWSVADGQMAFSWHTNLSHATREQKGLFDNTWTLWELGFKFLNSCWASELRSSRHHLVASWLLSPHPLVTPSLLLFAELLPMGAAAATFTVAAPLLGPVGPDQQCRGTSSGPECWYGRYRF